MSCDYNHYQKKLQKLQKKYATLRKNHKKLLGVTVLLTDALEEFVKGGTKSGINDVLLACSSIYPDLFDTGKIENRETGAVEIQLTSNLIEITDELGDVPETATEAEREYYEGFMARPKIPRTPHI